MNKCEQCGTTKNVSFWCYPDYDGYVADDDGWYLCSRCGGKPYYVVIGLGVLFCVSMMIFS